MFEEMEREALSSPSELDRMWRIARPNADRKEATREMQARLSGPPHARALARCEALYDRLLGARHLVVIGTQAYLMPMTKRLGMFLGLGFVGVVLLLTGLAWDAVVHANDPSLAGREGIFTLSNPGHVFLGVGIGLVLVSLIGGCDTLLAASRSGWWSGPGSARRSSR